MKISLLHLSDIHIHGDNDEILKESTNIASTCFADAHTSDAFFIIITGDVSYSGSVEEYKAITPFLNNIKNLIRAEGCPIVEILTVPGNHDCILKPTSTVRELLIQNVISNPEISEDDSVTTECSKVQDNYFEFRDQITQTASKFDHKLLTEYEFLICNKIVRFTAINASWMSRIPEVPGQLVFPANKFSDVISQPAEFRFVLIHHPLNWYYPSSSSELRRLINTHATAILSGHEHAEHNGITQDFDLGKNLYFEARALQPHEGNLKAGYSILTFNYGDQEVGRTATQKSFELDQNEINIMSVTDIPLEGVNSSLKECLALKDDFLKKICDPGGGYIHPDKEHLDIDDLFIYPEFKRKKFKEDKDDIEPIHYSIPSEEIMNAEMEQSKLLILGDEKAGKSTLLFKAYRELHNKGLMPLYIKANEINSYNESDFTKLIDKWAKDQYKDPNQFIRSPKKKRVVFVDDLDRLRGGLKLTLKLLRSLEKEFDSIILTASTGFEFSELVNKDVANALDLYTTYEITRFGHALRHKLIRKWCLCGQVITLHELDKRIYELETVVNMVVGKNLVPSQPFYLLILLQSSNVQSEQSELKNSSFAHYYEYLMTGNLKKSGVKRDEYDELFNYLSHLAWLFRTTDITEISKSELQGFTDQYSRNIFSVNLNDRLATLTSAKLINMQEDLYTFSYPYVYFFFLGRYLAKNLHKPEIKSLVSEWCSKLSIRKNANAILFLTYHVNDPWVIEQISSVLAKCFKSHTAIQLNGDISYINELVDGVTEQYLNLKELNVGENQTKIRKLRDVQDLEEENETEDESGDLDIFKELHLSLKTAEILGQIVKNYYGSLDRPMKKELIKEVFDTPLRFLKFIFELMHSDSEPFVAEVEKIITKKSPEMVALNKRQIARNIAFNLIGQICTGMLFRSAANISSDKLNDDILDLLKDNSSPAYELLAIGTKFISPKNLPLEKIKKLSNELKSNPLAFGILQSMGAIHIHQFHLKIEDRQRLCQFLGIDIDASQVIEYRTQETKMLKQPKG
jgi:hypothetical protein